MTVLPSATHEGQDTLGNGKEPEITELADELDQVGLSLLSN